jgi:DNA-binding transcriptional ArsR family regulator
MLATTTIVTDAADPNDDRLDLIFHALADRTRRSLLSRLANGSERVTDLAIPFDMSLNAVSKHIRVLERAGLVLRSVNGRIHRCSLGAEPLHEITRWLDYYRSFWEDALAAIADYVESGLDMEQ